MLGAVDAGDAMISLGTTGLLTLTTHRLESAAAGPHFVAASADDTRSSEEEGAVLWAANVPACGQLLAWFREMLGPAVRLPEGGDKIDYGSLDRAALAVPAGCGMPGGAAALHGPPHARPRSCRTRRLFGLTPSHTAVHIYRALLESFGYAVRRGFTQSGRASAA